MVYSNITICIWGNFFTSSWIIITFNSIKIDSWTFAFFICWYQLKCSFKFVCIYFFINKNRWYSITFFFLFFFSFSPSPRIIRSFKSINGADNPQDCKASKVNFKSLPPTGASPSPPLLAGS